MTYATELEIKRLTENLSVIRKVAGWSCADLGELIGVTKQTISNIETKTYKMTKTQYIAIRAVIDFEIQEHPENDLLAKIVELLLDSEETQENTQKTEATRALVKSATKASIAGGALAGLGMMLTTPALGAAIAPVIVSGFEWLRKLNKK